MSRFGKKYIEQLTGSEKLAYVFEKRLNAYVREHNGQFLRDETGSLHVVIDGRRVSLNYNRDNHALGKLMIDACGVTTIGGGAQAAIQRLQVTASETAGGLRLRRFSAVSEDGYRLYVPVRDGRLLQVTAEQIGIVPNGANQDSLWLEHPLAAPLTYSEADPAPSLREFKRLLVDTQACAVPEMQWFVAMAEGLFPFVRDLCPARLLMIHLGPSQCGKTTGAKRFVLLHGLGDVKGDYSVAALGNMPDPGLVVLDNKEQNNFSQALVDYCLFLATGAERGRSNADGINRTSGSRPAAAITSIEGVVRTELQKRCVNVLYEHKSPALKRGPIEKDIAAQRHMIGSALMAVLRRHLELRLSTHDLPNPIPEFEEHFTELCLLLMAYADLAGETTDWAMAIIRGWDEALSVREADESELEQPLLELLGDQSFTNDMNQREIEHNGIRGTLYVTETGHLLGLMYKLRREDLVLPKNPSGLGRRLRSTEFKRLSVLDEESAPEIECLKRKRDLRPIGIFLPEPTEYREAA